MPAGLDATGYNGASEPSISRLSLSRVANRLFPARLDSRLPVTDAKHCGSLRHLFRPLFLWSDLRLPQLEPKRFFVTLVALNACGEAAHLQYRGDIESSCA